MVKCVSILGSTGSIGRQSLDIISRLPEIRVAALTAGTRVDRMAEQCRQFHPELAVMATQEAAEQLSVEIKDLPIRVNWGEEGLIEAATMADMARKDILPAIARYVTDIAEAVSVGDVIGEDMRDSFEAVTARELTALKATAFGELTLLEKAAAKAKDIAEAKERAVYYKNSVVPVMEALRASVDAMEKLTCEDYWPMPNYGDLLFGVM